MGFTRCRLFPHHLVCFACVLAATSASTAGKHAAPAFQDEVVTALRVDAARSAKTVTMSPTFQADEWHAGQWSSTPGERALYKHLFRMGATKEIESWLESAYSVVLLKVRMQLGEDLQSIRCQDVASLLRTLLNPDAVPLHPRVEERMGNEIDGYKRKQGCSRNPDTLVPREIISAPASQFALKQMLHVLCEVQQAAEEEAEVLFMLQAQAAAAGLTNWQHSEDTNAQSDSVLDTGRNAEKGSDEEEDALVRMLRENPI